MGLIIYNTKNNIESGAFDYPEWAKRHIARCARDPLFFILKVCRTSDEHDEINPVKPFPEKQYIKLFIKQLMTYDRIIVEKSRQMMVTWMCLAWFLHNNLFRTHRKAFVVSKMAEDSDELLTRMFEMYERLPEHLKSPGTRKTENLIRIPGNHCKIKGGAQNANALRQFTASKILIDEDEHQENYEELITAAQPTVDGGGQLVTVGTPNLINHKTRIMTGEAFHKGTEDFNPDTQVFDDIEEIPGMRCWTNAYGWRCIRLHYSADPLKDAKWVVKTKLTKTPFEWEQEYEINRNVSRGKRVYPYFDYNTHVADLSYNKLRTLNVGIDYGYHTPAAVLFQYDDQDRCLILDEVIGKDVDAYGFFEYLRKYISKNYGKAHIRCFGDPAGEHVSDKGPKSSRQIAAKYGFFVSSMKRSVQYGTDIINKMHKKRKDCQPGIFYDHRCQNLIAGCQGGYSYKQDRLGRNLVEPHKDDIHDHTQDCKRYGITGTMDEDLKPLDQKWLNEYTFDEDRGLVKEIHNRFEGKQWSGYGVKRRANRY